MEKFLLEHGQGFAFVGQQVRIEIGGQEFYADLLFYHLKLRRYVVIELKAAEFRPGFLGHLGLYMAATDDLLAHPDDKPTIGLLLCKSKDNVVADDDPVCALRQVRRAGFFRAPTDSKLTGGVGSALDMLAGQPVKGLRWTIRSRSS